MEDLRFGDSIGDVNTLCYCLYDTELSHPLFSFLSQNCDADSLETKRTQILDSILQWIEGYVWQRDGFCLFRSSEMSPPWKEWNQMPCLWGCMQYGDSVEEEWFATTLLFKITKAFPSILARVWDDDGEFLLIEAALVLPKWITPETAKNRVWIKEGNIHIIPKTIPSVGPLTLTQAIETCNSDIQTEALEMDAVVKKRMKPFLTDGSSLQHKARCWLPFRVANLINHHPNIVTMAAKRFLNRDVLDLRHLSQPKHAKLVDMESIVVKFHRGTYARFKHAAFQPPESFMMPDLANVTFNEMDLGIKIACGIELLCQDFPRQEEEIWTSVQGTSETSSLASKQTMDYLLLCSSFRGDAFENRVVQTIHAALESQIPESHSISKNALVEDDDDWLEEGQVALGQEMKKRENENDPQDDTYLEEMDPNDLVETVNRFVDTMASHEGAEELKGISFRPEKFLRELEGALGDAFAEDFAKLRCNSPSKEETDAASTDTASTTTANTIQIESDSDDVSDFEAAYEEVLQTELQGTFMKNNLSCSVTRHESVDSNLISNLFESYQSQEGAPGPTSVLAASIPFKLYTKKKEFH